MRRRRPIGVGIVAVGLVAAALGGTACGSDFADDPTGGDEAETAVSTDDEGETLSLGELRELVEQRAAESGVPGSAIECVLDYLEETFDDTTAGDDADLAIEEAFGACTTEPAPSVPLEPGVPPAGG